MNTRKTALLRQIGAALLLFSVTAMWGGGFIFTKNTLADIPPLYFLFGRFLLGTIAIGLCACRKLRQTHIVMIKKGMITGIPLFVGYALQTIGLQYTTVGNSAFITGSYVVMVPFAGWFLSRNISSRQVGIGAVALLGLALFSLQGGFKVNSGDIWTLGCAAAYAVHFVILGHYTREMDSLLLTFWQIVMGTLLSGILAVFLEIPPAITSFNADTWQALLYCGILATALAFFIQTAAQKVLLPTQAAVIFTSEALFGAFFGWMFLGELFSSRQLLGAFILFGSMIGVLLRGGEAAAVAERGAINKRGME